MTNKNLKHNYFDSINSNNAYWAGFIANDGCVQNRDNVISITLSSLARDHLTKFKKDINLNLDVRNYKHSFLKTGEISRLEVCFAKAKTKLIEFGIAPKKTHTLKILNQELLNSRDFWTT